MSTWHGWHSDGRELTQNEIKSMLMLRRIIMRMRIRLGSAIPSKDIMRLKKHYLIDEQQESKRA